MVERLDQNDIDKILELRHTGISGRKIARVMKIDRGTVSRVLRGKWYAAPPRRPQMVESDRILLPDMQGPYEWCDGCRARVKKPCLACQLRARHT